MCKDELEVEYDSRDNMHFNFSYTILMAEAVKLSFWLTSRSSFFVLMLSPLSTVNVP